jgi:hypothetical protein
MVYLWIYSDKPDAARTSYTSAGLYLDLIVEQRLIEGSFFFFYTRGSNPSLGISIVSDKVLPNKRKFIDVEPKNERLFQPVNPLIINVPTRDPKIIWHLINAKKSDEQYVEATYSEKEKNGTLTLKSSFKKKYQPPWDMSVAYNILLLHIMPLLNRESFHQYAQNINLNTLKVEVVFSDENSLDDLTVDVVEAGFDNLKDKLSARVWHPIKPGPWLEINIKVDIILPPISIAEKPIKELGSKLIDVIGYALYPLSSNPLSQNKFNLLLENRSQLSKRLLKR